MSLSMPFRIIIVGGGTAGISPGKVLRGANQEITIFEQSGLNTEIGGTIPIQANEKHILQKDLESQQRARESVWDGAWNVPH